MIKDGSKKKKTDIKYLRKSFFCKKSSIKIIKKIIIATGKN